jgi:FMN reductase
MAQPLHVVGIGGTLSKTSKSLYALDYALSVAQAEGATITRFSMLDLQLPMYTPSANLEDLSPTVQDFIHTMRSADAMIWSTGAYHGTLAGVTKNAIDYMDYLGGGDNPYLHNKVVGLIATAGGDMAGVNTLGAMTHSVHSLRGIVAPLMVSIHNAKSAFDINGNITASKYEKKLSSLGQLVIELALKQQSNVYATTS